MDRVFLDANVIFSSAYRRDSDFRQLWRLPDARMVTSVYVVAEVLRNLHHPQHRSDLEELLNATEVVQVHTHDRNLPSGIDLPDKDRPVLLDAIAVEATHLLTGDTRHFRPYYDRTVEGVLILRPRDYLRSVLPQN